MYQNLFFKHRYTNFLKYPSFPPFPIERSSWIGKNEVFSYEHSVKLFFMQIQDVIVLWLEALKIATLERTCIDHLVPTPPHFLFSSMFNQTFTTVLHFLPYESRIPKAS